jgi:hypothetical protein
MKHTVLTATSLFIISFCLQAQNAKLNCKDVKTGVFYYYPKNSTGPYIVYMTDGFEKDVDMITGDTTLWKIDRIDDCSYKQSLISTNDRNIPEDTKKALKKHKIISNTLTVTDDYITYADYLDKISGHFLSTDTAWFHEKVNYKNTNLYQRVTDSSYITDSHFTDTSKYALLYIYRPGRGFLILARYLISLNDNIICIGKNKAGYIFKIFKEGDYTIKSNLYKDSSSVGINVQLGKVYYVKSLIEWGITSSLSNFRLKMENEEPEKGKEEFQAVDFQKDDSQTKINKIMTTIF